MPTALEHMQADMAYLFEQEGRDVSVDGENYKGFVRILDPTEGAYPGAFSARRAYWFMSGVMETPPMYSSIQIDGIDWLVESALDSGRMLEIIVRRNLA